MIDIELIEAYTREVARVCTLANKRITELEKEIETLKRNNE